VESRNRAGAQQCRDSQFQERGNVMTAEIVTLTRANAKAPKLVNKKLPPRRVPNAAVRSREYLTSSEIEALMASSKEVRSARPERRYGDPDCLPTRFESFRASRAALGSNRPEARNVTREPSQEWLRVRPSSPRARITRPETRAARLSEQPLRVLERTERPSHSLLCQEDRSASRTKRWHTVSRSPAHAPPCLRLQAGE